MSYTALGAAISGLLAVLLRRVANASLTHKVLRELEHDIRRLSHRINDATMALGEKLPRRRHERIVRPAGSRWNAIVHFIFRKKTYASSFEPLYWDLCNEEAELIANGENRKAKWLKICATYYYIAEIRRVIIPVEKLFSWLTGIAS